MRELIAKNLESQSLVLIEKLKDSLIEFTLIYKGTVHKTTVAICDVSEDSLYVAAHELIDQVQAAERYRDALDRHRRAQHSLDYLEREAKQAVASVQDAINARKLTVDSTP